MDIRVFGFKIISYITNVLQNTVDQNGPITLTENVSLIPERYVFVFQPIILKNGIFDPPFSYQKPEKVCLPRCKENKMSTRSGKTISLAYECSKPKLQPAIYVRTARCNRKAFISSVKLFRVSGKTPQGIGRHRTAEFERLFLVMPSSQT